MTTLAPIVKPTLADFGKELLAAGYKVYLPTSDVKRVANGGLESVGTWLKFSREVDGRTNYATVSLGYFDAASFSFPIKPSRQHGSSMWIGDAARLRDHETYGSATSEELSLHNAAIYTERYASNPIVGRHENYGTELLPGMYVEVTA